MQIDRQPGLGSRRPDRFPDLVHDRLGGEHPVENDPGRQAELGDPQQLGDSLLRRLARQWQQHDETAVRFLVQLARPVVDRTHAGGAQLGVLDLRDLLVRAVDQLGIDAVAVHVLAAVFGAGGAEDAGLGFLVEPRPGVAIDRPAADAAPADAAPHPPLDDPLPCAVRPLHDARPVILEAPRQALRPQIEGKMHQPAMPVGGNDAEPLLHGASFLAAAINVSPS